MGPSQPNFPPGKETGARRGKGRGKRCGSAKKVSLYVHMYHGKKIRVHTFWGRVVGHPPPQLNMVRSQNNGCGGPRFRILRFRVCSGAAFSYCGKGGEVRHVRLHLTMDRAEGGDWLGLQRLIRWSCRGAGIFCWPLLPWKLVVTIKRSLSPAHGHRVPCQGPSRCAHAWEPRYDASQGISPSFIRFESNQNSSNGEFQFAKASWPPTDGRSKDPLGKRSQPAHSTTSNVLGFKINPNNSMEDRTFRGKPLLPPSAGEGGGRVGVHACCWDFFSLMLLQPREWSARVRVGLLGRKERGSRNQFRVAPNAPSRVEFLGLNG